MIQQEQLEQHGLELFMVLREYLKNIGSKFKTEKNWKF